MSFPFSIAGLLSTRSGIIPASVAGSTLLVIDGDSITEPVTFTLNSYAKLYVDSDTSGKLVAQNVATGGSYLSDVISREATKIAYVGANVGKANYIYTVLIGVNERLTAYYPSGASTFATDLGAHLDTMRAAGFTKIAIGTLPDFYPGNSGFVTWRAAMNTAIRGLYPAKADAIIDFGADPTMGTTGAALDTNLFLDELHPAANGHIALERVYAPVINALIEAAEAPGQVTGLAAGTATNSTQPLTWTGPSTGGYYTDFVVQYKKAVDSVWTTFADGTGRTASTTVTGLDSNTSYNYRVLATGEGGDGAWSSTLTASTAPDVALAWDTASEGTSVTISNGDIDAASNASSWGSARTNIGKSTGKWYVEFKIQELSGGDPQYILKGIADATTSPMNAYLGNFANSVGQIDASFYNSGFTSGASINTSHALNDIFAIAFDADARKCWIAKNNTWLGSGDPAAGTNPWVTWGSARTIYPAVGLYGTTKKVRLMTTNYSPPSGFSVLA